MPAECRTDIKVAACLLPEQKTAITFLMLILHAISIPKI